MYCSCVLIYLVLLVIVSNKTGVDRLKIINVSRGPVHEYENVKRKLHNCDANIYCNHKYSQKQLIPN